MRKKSVAEGCRAHVYYSGRVQGVGFRYTTERIALDAGVRGWVKNLPDGRVELVCEGKRPDVEGVLEAIRRSPLGPKIAKTACTWEAATGEFGDFRVEFDY